MGGFRLSFRWPDENEATVSTLNPQPSGPLRPCRHPKALIPTGPFAGAKILDSGLRLLVRWPEEELEAYVPMEALLARLETAVAVIWFLHGKITKPKLKVAKANVAEPQVSEPQVADPQVDDPLVDEPQAIQPAGQAPGQASFDGAGDRRSPVKPRLRSGSQSRKP